MNLYFSKFGENNAIMTILSTVVPVIDQIHGIEPLCLENSSLYTNKFREMYS